MDSCNILSFVAMFHLLWAHIFTCNLKPEGGCILPVIAFRLDVTSLVMALALDDKSPSPDNVLICCWFCRPHARGRGQGCSGRTGAAMAGRPPNPPLHSLSIPSSKFCAACNPPHCPANLSPAVTLFILFSLKVVHMACIIQVVRTRTVV